MANKLGKKIQVIYVFGRTSGDIRVWGFRSEEYPNDGFIIKPHEMASGYSNFLADINFL